MKRFAAFASIVIIAAFTCSLGCGEDGPPKMKHVSELRADVERENPTTNDAELLHLVSDKTSFALWMYHEGVEVSGSGKNMVFSPLSISTAFAMLWPGGVGDTAAEIAAMLHFGMSPDSFHPAANRLDRELANRNDYQPRTNEGDAPILEIVNDLWGLDEYPYVDAYLELLARHYGAGMWIVDFINAPEEARQEINAYIAYKTRQLIQELLPAESISELTRLVITNAIYFKGAWRFEFEKSDTTAAPFTALNGTATDVQMMSGMIGSALYASVEGAEVVDVPYVGNDLSMTFILPAEDTFSSFEAGLEAEETARILGELEEMAGLLKMPRFKFDTALELVGIFAANGFTVPFTPGLADFSGLSQIAVENQLHVSAAFHQAAIAVDEEGTEAAAATAIVMGDGSAGPPDDYFEVTLDRPFIFLIRDRPTGAILFMGRVVDAAAAQS